MSHTRSASDRSGSFGMACPGAPLTGAVGIGMDGACSHSYTDKGPTGRRQHRRCEPCKSSVHGSSVRAGELQTWQADGGAVAGGRTMRRWISSIPNKLADVTHPADRDPVPGVADTHVPNDIGRRQGLPRAPLMGLREVVSGLGLSGICGQADTGQHDAARQQCCGSNPLQGVAGFHGQKR
jgi:hypothetical protein